MLPQSPRRPEADGLVSPVVLGQADREYVSADLGQGPPRRPQPRPVLPPVTRALRPAKEQVEAEVGDVHRSAAIRGGR